MTELEVFLASRGFRLDPAQGETHSGYVCASQKKCFSQRLTQYEPIRKVAEIGLNGGHSADFFFNRLPNLELFASFDINRWPYTKYAVEYLQNKHKERFFFVEGDSLKTVPLFAQHFPHHKFDLIYIDGCHAFDWALGDILHAKELAHPSTTLWIDDVQPDFLNPVGAAVQFCARLGLIHIGQSLICESPYGQRYWIEARYLY
jgi:predicted O-methyltransferase YrrM